MNNTKKNEILREITASEYRCSLGGCPAVFETQDQLVIIGKRLSSNISNQIDHRIADDEQAIVVDKEMILSSLRLNK